MVRGQIKRTCDTVGLPQDKMKERVISSSKAVHMVGQHYFIGEAGAGRIRLHEVRG